MPGVAAAASTWSQSKMRGYAERRCRTLAIMLASVRSVADLVAAQAQGHQVKFLFFWGHQPERDGGVGAGCLSQWWPVPFTADDMRFATAEHYMMWRKATLFGFALMQVREVLADQGRQGTVPA